MRRRSSSFATPPARCRQAISTLGKPTVAKLALAGDGFPARRLDVQQLIRLADAPPAEPPPGGSARAIFALVELAQRSVAEGLVHPDLDHGGGWWHAFWGATLDQSVQATLTEIAAALPAVSADAFDGDRDATVHDLYPVLVDQLARDRLRADGVRLGHHHEAGSPHGARPLPRRAHGSRRGAATARRLLGSRPEAVGLGRRRPRPTHVDSLADRPAPRRAGRRRPRARAVAAGRGRPDARASRVAAVERRRRRLRLPARRRPAARSDPPARRAGPGARRAGDRVRRDRAGRGRARSRDRPPVPAQRRCRRSRSAAFPSCCRPRGCARPAACGSTSPPRASLHAARAASSPRRSWRGSTGGSRSATSSSPRRSSRSSPRPRSRSSASPASGMRSAARTSSGRFASSTAAARVPGSSISSAPSRASRPTRRASSSARSRSTRRSPRSSTTASSGSARARRPPR